MDSEHIARSLRAALKRARPKAPSGWLAMQNGVDQFVYTGVVDGFVCDGCGGTDGAVIAVPSAEMHVDGSDILLFAFDHGGSPVSVAYSIEQCKQLVNRLGEAIAVAEGVDRAGT